jgi:hypothetical protein
MMELKDLVTQVAEFDATTPREKMRLFAWYLHVHGSKCVFEPGDIKACYDKLHLSQINIAMNLNRMADSKPPDLLRERKGFKLARAVRVELDAKYGIHDTVVQVSKLLADLVGKIPDLSEKHFLAEAVKCYRHEAYRACVVMTWNLAYSHLVQWILNDAQRLGDFNTAITKRYPRKTGLSVSKYDDFTEELKESEVVEICNSAGLVNGNVIRVLREKLGKRNSAAHPASIVIVQSQADDVITDLVNNVVLALT